MHLTLPALRSIQSFGPPVGTLSGCFALLCLLAACTRPAPVPPEVAANLAKAGANRPELEKVFAHYQKPGDSLKLRAAYFLVANMDDLTHADPASLTPYNQVVALYDSLLRRKVLVNETDKQYPVIDHAWDSIVAKAGRPGNSVRFYPDLNVIKADFLIANIDNAFLAWQTKPWARHISFADFCDYMLPYNFSQNPLDDWRSRMMNQYDWLADSLTNKNSSAEACVVLCEHLKWFLYNPQLWERKGHSLYGINNLLRGKAGSCGNKVNLNIYVMRANGFAVTTDYVPGWANRDWGHSWNAFIAEDGRFLDFEAFAERREWGGRMPDRLLGKPVEENFRKVNPVRMSKVFRATYARQPRSLLGQVGLAGKKDIPPAFHGDRQLDVSDEYFPVTDVELPLYPQEDRPAYAYLCTYNNNEWVPVHWGKIRPDRKTTFTKMGRDVVYVSMYYRQGRLHPASPAFVLQPDQKLRWLKPVPSQTRTVTLHRTHPVYSSDTIQVNNCYELFYWDDKWISLGKKRATRNRLTYANVPANALLWLLHSDRGPDEQKERIFTFENGVQQWW